jgi:hypothetical protein
MMTQLDNGREVDAEAIAALRRDLFQAKVALDEAREREGGPMPSEKSPRFRRHVQRPNVVLNSCARKSLNL